MNDKLTANEMAERNSNAMIKSGLANVPKPPQKIGNSISCTLGQVCKYAMACAKEQHMSK